MPFGFSPPSPNCPQLPTFSRRRLATASFKQPLHLSSYIRGPQAPGPELQVVLVCTRCQISAAPFAVHPRSPLSLHSLAQIPPSPPRQNFCPLNAVPRFRTSTRQFSIILNYYSWERELTLCLRSSHRASMPTTHPGLDGLLFCRVFAPVLSGPLRPPPPHQQASCSFASDCRHIPSPFFSFLPLRGSRPAGDALVYGSASLNDLLRLVSQAILLFGGVSPSGFPLDKYAHCPVNDPGFSLSRGP